MKVLKRKKINEIIRKNIALKKLNQILKISKELKVLVIGELDN